MHLLVSELYICQNARLNNKKKPVTCFIACSHHKVLEGQI